MVSLFSPVQYSLRRFAGSAHTRAEDYFGGGIGPTTKDTPKPGQPGYDYMNKVGLKGQLRDSTYLRECFIPRECVQERVYIIAATHPNAREDLIIEDETLLEGLDGLGLDSLDMVFYYSNCKSTELSEPLFFLFFKSRSCHDFFFFVRLNSALV